MEHIVAPQFDQSYFYNSGLFPSLNKFHSMFEYPDGNLWLDATEKIPQVKR